MTKCRAIRRARVVTRVTVRASEYCRHTRGCTAFEVHRWESARGKSDVCRTRHHGVSSRCRRHASAPSRPSLPLHAAAQDSVSLARLKIAPDLLTTVGSSALPDVPWARLLGGEMLVRALVVANSDDPTLTALRRQVVAMGGSVNYNYVVDPRAGGDGAGVARWSSWRVAPTWSSISPNRAVTRTASVLQATTGANEADGAERHAASTAAASASRCSTRASHGATRACRRACSASRALTPRAPGGRLRAARQGPDATWPGCAGSDRSADEPGQRSRRSSLDAAAAPAAARPVRPRHARGVDRRRQRAATSGPTPPASRRTPTCTTCACSTTTASATWPT